MVGWHDRLNGNEFEHALGVGDGQESLACCRLWSYKEPGMTDWLKWLTELTNWLNIAKIIIWMLYIRHVDISVMIKKVVKSQIQVQVTFFFFYQIDICCCCSVTESYLNLYNPMGGSTADFLVIHHLLELAQTYVSWVSDAIQLSHLSTPSPLVFNLCHNQGIF